MPVGWLDDPGIDGNLLAGSTNVDAPAAPAGLGARTVAFPAVSAGAYGWDADEVALVAVDAVRGAPAPGVELVRFVLFSERLEDAFATALAAS